MALFGLFSRKKSPIREPKELAEFIDEQATSLVQEGMLHHVRARAGDQADEILGEEAFARQAESARWRAYPLGLAMVGEMADGMLRPHAGTQQRALADETIDLVLSMFDRHTVPIAIGKDAWLDARSELALRLDQISTQPPRSVVDIPAQYLKRFLAVMPSHPGMTHSEAGAALDGLKRALVNEQQDLEKRMDPAAMVKALLAGGED